MVTLLLKKENKDLTKKVQEINVVDLAVWKVAFSCLNNIIECLIESPDRAFHRDYWQELSKFEVHLSKTEKWTLESKIEKLKRKASYYKK